MGLHTPDTIFIVHLYAWDFRDKSGEYDKRGYSPIGQQSANGSGTSRFASCLTETWTSQPRVGRPPPITTIKILGGPLGIIQFLRFVRVDNPFRVAFGPRRSPAKLVLVIKGWACGRLGVVWGRCDGFPQNHRQRMFVHQISLWL